MVQIHLSYGESTSFEMVMGFEMASAWWSDILTDDVDVYFHVDGVSDLPSHIVGGALPAVEEDEKYEKIRESLLEDVTSSADQLAVDHLNAEKKFSIAANGDSDLSKTEKMQLTRANAKALGLENSDNEKLDGYILVSDLSGRDDYSWDFAWDRQAAFEDGNLDFFAVALHEVGHLLGFVSGVDDAKWLETVVKRQDKIEESLEKMEDKPNEFSDSAMKFANPLDLFRFSKEGYAEGKQDLSIGNDAYFSIDGGKTALASFSTGKSGDLGGDGYQASHWKQSDEPVGVMDPLLIAEQRRSLADVDVTALDVIGWDINPDGLAFDLNRNLAEVEQHLAQRSGMTVEALYHNSDAVLEALTDDRSKDIHKMLKETETYEWGSRRWSSSSSRWQELLKLFEEEGSFQTIADIQPVVPKPDRRATVPIVDAVTALPSALRPQSNVDDGASLPAFSRSEPIQPLSYPVGAVTPAPALESVGISSIPSAPTPPPGTPLSNSVDVSAAYPVVANHSGIQDSARTDLLPGLLAPLLHHALEIHPLMQPGGSLLHG